MNKTTNVKLNHAFQNSDAYIKQLTSMPDSKLSKHLDLFRQQMQMAYEQKNYQAYELLVEYERQVFMARLNKFDSMNDNDSKAKRGRYKQVSKYQSTKSHAR